MAKIVQILTRPSDEYSKQIADSQVRDLDSVIQKLNTTYQQELKDEAEERLNIDKMKAMMNQSIQEDKLDQNEELANLRADTSLEKQEIANEAREKLAMMKTNGRGQR